MGPADYFGTDINEVFRLDAIDADIDPDYVFEENKVELLLLSGLPFSAGDAMWVLLGVNDRQGAITWTQYEDVAGDSSETVVRVDVDTLDDASCIAFGKLARRYYLSGRISALEPRKERAVRTIRVTGMGQVMPGPDMTCINISLEGTHQK